jgi:hypothetical protein
MYAAPHLSVPLVAWDDAADSNDVCEAKNQVVLHTFWHVSLAKSIENNIRRKGVISVCMR